MRQSEASAGRRHWKADLETVLVHSPLQTAFRLASRQRLCVLAYHGIADAEAFARQLDWLSRHATPVSLAEARRALLEGGRLPPHAVLLTFDDGERSILEVAAPLLKERGIPAVAYVVGGLVGTDAPFWWTEVEALAARGAVAEASSADLVRRLKTVPDAERRRVIADLRARVTSPVRAEQLNGEELRKLELDGISIGNHSLTHPCLDRCEEAVIRHEVEESHRRLTDLLGHPPESFAYPNGNWDERAKRAVRDAGYDLAFAFDHRLVARSADPLVVARVRIDSTASVDRLRILASGLHPWLLRLRGRA